MESWAAGPFGSGLTWLGRPGRGDKVRSRSAARRSLSGGADGGQPASTVAAPAGTEEQRGGEGGRRGACAGAAPQRAPGAVPVRPLALRRRRARHGTPEPRTRPPRPKEDPAAGPQEKPPPPKETPWRERLPQHLCPAASGPPPPPLESELSSPEIIKARKHPTT